MKFTYPWTDKCFQPTKQHSQHCLCLAEECRSARDLNWHFAADAFRIERPETPEHGGQETSFSVKSGHWQGFPGWTPYDKELVTCEVTGHSLSRVRWCSIHWDSGRFRSQVELGYAPSQLYFIVQIWRAKSVHVWSVCYLYDSLVSEKTLMHFLGMQTEINWKRTRSGVSQGLKGQCKSQG